MNCHFQFSWSVALHSKPSFCGFLWIFFKHEKNKNYFLTLFSSVDIFFTNDIIFWYFHLSLHNRTRNSRTIFISNFLQFCAGFWQDFLNPILLLLIPNVHFWIHLNKFSVLPIQLLKDELLSSEFLSAKETLFTKYQFLTTRKRKISFLFYFSALFDGAVKNNNRLTELFELEWSKKKKHKQRKCFSGRHRKGRHIFGSCCLGTVVATREKKKNSAHEFIQKYLCVCVCGSFDDLL